MARRTSALTTASEGAPRDAKRRLKQRWPYIRKRVYPNGSIGWMVDSRTADGGERKTFGTIAEAETHAENCRIQRKNNGDSGFYNAELDRYGKTVQDAIAFYLDHLRQQERSVPIPDAISELVKMRRGSGKSERYCHDLELRLGRFRRSFEGRTTADVGPKDLDEWLTGLPVAPGTRNTFRRDLRTLFSFCVKRGYSVSNPAAATERAKDIDSSPGILSVPQARRILCACTPEMLPYFSIGLFAGLRSAELEKLDWSEIDLASGFIEVKAHKAKTARRRLVKIETALASFLKPLERGLGPIAPEALRYRFDDVKRAAGFGTPGSETDAERKAGVKLTPWPQNALRHSYGSYWLAQHQDAAALALQMGNSQAMIFTHYRELVRPKDAAAFWGLVPTCSAWNESREDRPQQHALKGPSPSPSDEIQ